jgi:hypothetical protein
MWEMEMSMLRIVTRPRAIAPAILSIAFVGVSMRPARAVPAFAAQTGQPCQMCHIGALGPQLTPYGRNFKIKGYTLTGGTGIMSKVHLAAWLQTEFSSYQKKLPPDGVTPDFSDNNNLFINAASVFYAGRVTDNIGVFLQGTYDNVAKVFAQDNSEVRVVGSGTAAGHSVDYGVSFNNAPGWSDPYNSNYLWGYPFISNGIAPAPNASPILAGAVQDNSLGAVGYAWIDQHIYVDLGGYESQPTGFQKVFGETYGPGSSTGLEPWASLTYAWFWGDNNAHIGGHYFYGRYSPATDVRSSNGQFGNNSYQDFMLSNGYQYIGEDLTNVFTIDGLYDYETQNLVGSSNVDSPFYSSSKAHNNLSEFKEWATYYYQETYGATIGFDKIWGNSNDLLYNTGANDTTGSIKGSPNSTSFSIEGDWVPFGKEDSFWRPFINMKLGIQYTFYTEFNGSSKNYDGFGRNASDNNTLFVFLWTVF